MGFSNTRRQARQFVRHGHITVNGKRVDIPSALVKVGDVIEVCEKSQGKEVFKAIKEVNNAFSAPPWLDSNQANLKGSVTRFPTREDISDIPVNEQSIIELYSR